MKRSVPFFICDFYLVMNGAALFGMYCARSERHMSDQTTRFMKKQYRELLQACCQ